MDAREGRRSTYACARIWRAGGAEGRRGSLRGALGCGGLVRGEELALAMEFVRDEGGASLQVDLGQVLRSCITHLH